MLLRKLTSRKRRILDEAAWEMSVCGPELERMCDSSKLRAIVGDGATLYHLL